MSVLSVLLLGLVQGNPTSTPTVIHFTEADAPCKMSSPQVSAQSLRDLDDHDDPGGGGRWTWPQNPTTAIPVTLNVVCDKVYKFDLLQILGSTESFPWTASTFIVPGSVTTRALKYRNDRECLDEELSEVSSFPDHAFTSVNERLEIATSTNPIYAKELAITIMAGPGQKQTNVRYWLEEIFLQGFEWRGTWEICQTQPPAEDPTPFPTRPPYDEDRTWHPTPMPFTLAPSVHPTPWPTNSPTRDFTANAVLTCSWNLSNFPPGTNFTDLFEEGSLKFIPMLVGDFDAEVTVPGCEGLSPEAYKACSGYYEVNFSTRFPYYAYETVLEIAIWEYNENGFQVQDTESENWNRISYINGEEECRWGGNREICPTLEGTGVGGAEVYCVFRARKEVMDEREAPFLVALRDGTGLWHSLNPERNWEPAQPNFYVPEEKPGGGITGVITGLSPWVMALLILLLLLVIAFCFKCCKWKKKQAYERDEEWCCGLCGNEPEQLRVGTIQAQTTQYSTRGAKLSEGYQGEKYALDAEWFRTEFREEAERSGGLKRCKTLQPPQRPKFTMHDHGLYCCWVLSCRILYSLIFSFTALILMIAAYNKGNLDIIRQYDEFSESRSGELQQMHVEIEEHYNNETRRMDGIYAQYNASCSATEGLNEELAKREASIIEYHDDQMDYKAFLASVDQTQTRWELSGTRPCSTASPAIFDVNNIYYYNITHATRGPQPADNSGGFGSVQQLHLKGQDEGFVLSMLAPFCRKAFWCVGYSYVRPAATRVDCGDSEWVINGKTYTKGSSTSGSVWCWGSDCLECPDDSFILTNGTYWTFDKLADPVVDDKYRLGSGWCYRRLDSVEFPDDIQAGALSREKETLEDYQRQVNGTITAAEGLLQTLENDNPQEGAPADYFTVHVDRDPENDFGMQTWLEYRAEIILDTEQSFETNFSNYFHVDLQVFCPNCPASFGNPVQHASQAVFNYTKDAVNGSIDNSSLYTMDSVENHLENYVYVPEDTTFIGTMFDFPFTLNFESWNFSSVGPLIALFDILLFCYRHSFTVYLLSKVYMGKEVRVPTAEVLKTSEESNGTMARQNRTMGMNEAAGYMNRENPEIDKRNRWKRYFLGDRGGAERTCWDSIVMAVAKCSHDLSMAGPACVSAVKYVLLLIAYLGAACALYILYQVLGELIDTDAFESAGFFDIMTSDLFVHRTIRNTALASYAARLNAIGLAQLAYEAEKARFQIQADAFDFNKDELYRINTYNVEFCARYRQYYRFPNRLRYKLGYSSASNTQFDASLIQDSSPFSYWSPNLEEEDTSKEVNYAWLAMQYDPLIGMGIDRNRQSYWEINRLVMLWDFGEKTNSGQFPDNPANGVSGKLSFSVWSQPILNDTDVDAQSCWPVQMDYDWAFVADINTAENVGSKTRSVHDVERKTVVPELEKSCEAVGCWDVTKAQCRKATTEGFGLPDMATLLPQYRPEFMPGCNYQAILSNDGQTVIEESVVWNPASPDVAAKEYTRDRFPVCFCEKAPPEWERAISTTLAYEDNQLSMPYEQPLDMLTPQTKCLLVTFPKLYQFGTNTAEAGYRLAEMTAEGKIPEDTLYCPRAKFQALSTQHLPNVCTVVNPIHAHNMKIFYRSQWTDALVIAHIPYIDALRAVALSPVVMGIVVMFLLVIYQTCTCACEICLLRMGMIRKNLYAEVPVRGRKQYQLLGQDDEDQLSPYGQPALGYPPRAVMPATPPRPAPPPRRRRWRLFRRRPPNQQQAIAGGTAGAVPGGGNNMIQLAVAGRVAGGGGGQPQWGRPPPRPGQQWSLPGQPRQLPGPMRIGPPASGHASRGWGGGQYRPHAVGRGGGGFWTGRPPGGQHYPRVAYAGLMQIV